MMDALFWYGLAISAIAILGTAGRWAERELQRASSPRRLRIARAVLRVALGALYLAFALGVATALYAVGTSTVITTPIQKTP
jgi:hypothetical protein